MYTNFHAAIGTGIVMGTYALTKSETLAAIVGGGLAFASHDLVDRLGEKNYGGFKQFLKVESILFIIFITSAVTSGFWKLFAIGWLGGNMMDLIDKKGGLSMINREKFPFGKFFICHRRKPNINLTKKQTYAAAYISGAAVILMSIISNL